MKPIKTTRGIRPNAGVQKAYARRLKALCAEMEKSVVYWLKAAYAKQDPAMTALLAQDSALSNVQEALVMLGTRWLKKFADEADDIASKYLTRAFDATDKQFQNALIDAGWAVQFKPSRAIREAMYASIDENIMLIKSIPEQYLNKVQGMALRSITAGRDLESFYKELRGTLGVTQRRAELIAIDQTNKATTAIRQARAAELGITEAIWCHSHAGKEPRKSHVAADGKRYDIAQGCYIDGEYIQPAEKINCRCFAKMVLPF